MEMENFLPRFLGAILDLVVCVMSALYFTIQSLFKQPDEPAEVIPDR